MNKILQNLPIHQKINQFYIIMFLRNLLNGA